MQHGPMEGGTNHYHDARISVFWHNEGPHGRYEVTVYARCDARPERSGVFDRRETPTVEGGRSSHRWIQPGEWEAHLSDLTAPYRAMGREEFWCPVDRGAACRDPGHVGRGGRLQEGDGITRAPRRCSSSDQGALSPVWSGERPGHSEENHTLA